MPSVLAPSALRMNGNAVASTSQIKAVEGNFVGLFAGDWATEDKITLLAETFTVFSSLQKIASDEVQRRNAAALHNRASISSMLPSSQAIQYYNRISGLYRDALKRYIQILEAADADAPEVELTRWLHTILHFAETLYIPTDGRGAGVVGEEVLHWLNSFDYALETEEGQEIAQSAVPHEHPTFWSYIFSCVLRGLNGTASSLLSSLSDTPISATLNKVSQRTARLLSTMPRSTTYTLEHDFVSAHRKWLAQVRSLLNGLERDMDEIEGELRATSSSKSAEEIEDERLEYEAQFRCVLEIMAGVQERVFEACDDWKEALGAWGVLIQPTLKRDDIPGVLQLILSNFPLDRTLSHETILASLAQGEVTKACQLMQKYDPWLAAHLTDLLDHVGVLEDSEEGSNSRPLRLTYIEQYAETVLDDQGLWRLAVDYLSYCGPSARLRMSYIILDVPITGPNAIASRKVAKSAADLEADADDAEMDEQSEDPEQAAEQRRLSREAQEEARKVSDESKIVIDVLQTCVDLQMDLEARAICKKMAVEMTARKHFGSAIAYSVRANDVRQLKRIADMVLLQYIQDGVAAFCQTVDSIPSSLLQPSDLEQDEYLGEEDMKMETETDAGTMPIALSRVVLAPTPAIYSSRLAFLARYRDFHREYVEDNLGVAATLLVDMLSSGVASERFWAVMLVDAIPLLHDSVLPSYFTKEQAYELLRVLDQVTTASALHPLQAQHYLGYLEQLLVGPSKTAKMMRSRRGDEDEFGSAAFDVRAATQRLDILRLALARRLASVGE